MREVTTIYNKRNLYLINYVGVPGIPVAEPLQVWYRYHDSTGQRENWISIRGCFCFIVPDNKLDDELFGARPNRHFT